MGGVCWRLSSLNSLASSHSSWMDITHGFHRCVLCTKDTAKDEVLRKEEDTKRAVYLIVRCGHLSEFTCSLCMRGLSLLVVCAKCLQWWLT